MAPDPAHPHIAVCPGSYDPITNGHIDVITRAAEIFDEVIVTVVNASVRKDLHLFKADERVEFIESATRHLPNVRVETFDILIVDYARRVGAKAIVKGLRAISDFEYELEMNQLNRHLADDIESVYLMASPQYSFLSSSGVKEIATFGGDVSNLVPDEVARRLKEALAR
jgi:pantetheine-phosphate adenylyltransferase